MSKSSRSSAQSIPGSGIVHLLVKFAVLLLGLGASAALLLALALALAWPNLPELSAMTDYRPRVPLRIYTADKVLIGEFGEERRNVRSEERRVGNEWRWRCTSVGCAKNSEQRCGRRVDT